MFMMLSLYQRTATARVHPVHLVSAAQATSSHRPLTFEANQPEPQICLQAAIVLHSLSPFIATQLVLILPPDRR